MSVIAKLEAIGHEVLSVSASVASKIVPIVDDAAQAVSLLDPELAAEAQAIRLLVDKLNELLQSEASGTESALLTDVAQIMAQAEPLIRN